MTKKFIMVSLEEDGARDIANVLSNENCRKILDYLADKPSSESDLVKVLKLPASTVNYNIKLLLRSKLIEMKDFFWSEKGNKINVYRAAKKFIVIVPKGSRVGSQLKDIIPVFLVVIIASGLLFLYNKIIKIGTVSKGLVAESVLRENIMVKGMEKMIIAPQPEPSFALWFLVGAVFSIIIYIIYILIKGRE